MATAFRFEPALRRAVRAAIAESPSLTVDYRRAKRARRPSLWKIFYNSAAVILAGPMMAVGIPLVVIVGIEQHAGADGLFAFGAALSTAISLAGAQFFVSRLRQSKPISVLSHLPVADAGIAHHIWREIAAGSLVVLYPVLLAFGYLAWKNGFGFGGWSLAALLAVIHWLTCLATGTNLAIFQPRFPFKEACGLVAVAGLLYFHAGAPNLVDVTLALYLLVPAGWVNALLGLAFLQQAAQAWWTAAAAILWIALAFLALRRLTQRYVIEELSFPPDAEASASLAPPFSRGMSRIARLWEFLCPWWANNRAEEEWELSDAEAERQVRTGSFLQPVLRPRSHVIERVVDRWLSDRERIVLEVLTGNRSRWSEWWWMSAFGGATVSVMQAAGAMLAPFNMGLASLMVGYVSLLYFWSGPWPGLRTKECAGAFVAWFSVQPVGFDEISTVMLKVGLVRCLFVFLLVLSLAACGVGPPVFNPQLAVLIAVGYAILLVVLQGWVISFHLSIGMRLPDLRLRTLGWHVLPVVFIVGSLFIGLPLVFVGVAQRVPSAELFFAGGIIVLAICSWTYKRTRHRGNVGGRLQAD